MGRRWTSLCFRFTTTPLANGRSNRLPTEEDRAADLEKIQKAFFEDDEAVNAAVDAALKKDDGDSDEDGS